MSMPLTIGQTITACACAFALATPAIAQDTKATSDTEATATTETKIVVEGEKPKITDRSHPDYIRCRKEPVIGSRTRMKKTCLTNREWKEVARTGNRDSRGFVEENQAGFNGNGS